MRGAGDVDDATRAEVLVGRAGRERVLAKHISPGGEDAGRGNGHRIELTGAAEYSIGSAEAAIGIEGSVAAKARDEVTGLVERPTDEDLSRRQNGNAANSSL